MTPAANDAVTQGPVDPELDMAKACDGEIKATPGDPCTPPECRAPL